MTIRVPSFCCCPCECDQCDSGTTTKFKQVTIEGVEEGTCGSCDDFNGVYLFQQFGSVFGCCVWVYDFEEEVCGVGRLEYIEGGGAFLAFRVSSAGGVSTIAEFVDNVSVFPRDCREEVNLTFFQHGGFTSCDWSGATIDVVGL